MTNMQLAGRLLTAPRRFFDDLADSPRFALPMWAIVLCTAGMVFWFYSIVDLQWIIDQQLQNNPNAAQMTDAQREAAGRFMTRGLLTWGALIATVFFLFVIRLLEALYYRIAGKATGHARSYRQWFAFAWWTSMPGLIGVIPSVHHAGVLAQRADRSGRAAAAVVEYPVLPPDAEGRGLPGAEQHLRADLRVARADRRSACACGRSARGSTASCSRCCRSRVISLAVAGLMVRR